MLLTAVLAREMAIPERKAESSSQWTFKLCSVPIIMSDNIVIINRNGLLMTVEAKISVANMLAFIAREMW